jgi:hypothetical protein
MRSLVPPVVIAIPVTRNLYLEYDFDALMAYVFSMFVVFVRPDTTTTSSHKVPSLFVPSKTNPLGMDAGTSTLIYTSFTTIPTGNLTSKSCATYVLVTPVTLTDNAVPTYTPLSYRPEFPDAKMDTIDQLNA